MKKLILLLLLSSFCFGQNESTFKGIVCIPSIKKVQEPIFIIDGITVQREEIESLNPNEIENIQVFKDATATALYGSRGKNGVIVINTKKYIEELESKKMEYDLIVTEFGFDSFLAQQNSERFYSLEFLKSKNRLYVNEWNSRVLTGNPDIYDMRIDYQPQVRYGLNFEYKLYQFFKFIEQKHKTKLI